MHPVYLCLQIRELEEKLAESEQRVQTLEREKEQKENVVSAPPAPSTPGAGEEAHAELDVKTATNEQLQARILQLQSQLQQAEDEYSSKVQLFVGEVQKMQAVNVHVHSSFCVYSLLYVHAQAGIQGMQSAKKSREMQDRLTDQV